MPDERRQDFNGAALSAGLTTFLWYAFGGLPLQIAVAHQMGLSAERAASWIAITWLTSAVASLTYSWHYRLPLPIGWTIPGLLYLGTLGGQYSDGELVAANLAAGVIIALIGVLGLGARLIAWLPVPVIMGMFAGSILEYALRLVRATTDDFAVAGPIVIAFFLARTLNNRKIPPVGVALVVGIVALVARGVAPPADVAWTLPTFELGPIEPTVQSIVTVAVPLAVLSVGVGNVGGIGFLISQGYKVPTNTLTTTIGVVSVINAVFGGHPATFARNGAAMVAGPDAGPLAGRYWACIVVALLQFTVVIGAAPIAALLSVLPKSFMFALAGVAILASLQDAFEKAFGGTFKFSSLVAFIVAATPFSFLGLSSDFWALPFGMVAAIGVDRRDLRALWRTESQ